MVVRRIAHVAQGVEAPGRKRHHREEWTVHDRNAEMDDLVRYLYKGHLGELMLHGNTRKARRAEDLVDLRVGAVEEVPARVRHGPFHGAYLYFESPPAARQPLDPRTECDVHLRRRQLPLHQPLQTHSVEGVLGDGEHVLDQVGAEQAFDGLGRWTPGGADALAETPELGGVDFRADTADAR